MGRSVRLLIVEDSADDAELMLHALRRGGLDPTWKRVETADELRAELGAGNWDAVISDNTLPSFSATSALKVVRVWDKNLPFLVVSGTVGEEVAVGIMRAGANDYVLKDSLARLAPALERELLAASDLRARRVAEQAAFRLAAIVESSDDAIISETPDGTITSWNLAAEKLYGWTGAEAIGRNAFFLVPLEKRTELTEVLEKLKRREPVEHLETGRLRKDGRRIGMSVAVSSIRDRHDRLIGISKIERDISGHQRLQRELRNRLQQQVVVAELSRFALQGGDLTALMREATRVVSETLGTELCSVLELQPDNKSLRLWAGIGWKPGLIGQAIFSAGIDVQAGYTLLSENPVLVEDLNAESRFSSSRMLQDQGVVAGVSLSIRGRERPLGVLEVYTARRRRFSPDDVNFLTSVANLLASAMESREAQSSLRTSETRYRRLFEAAQDGVLIVDGLSGEILEVNPFLMSLLGYNREELIGKQLWRLGLFGEIVSNKTTFQLLQERGYVRYDDHPLRSKDGRQIDVEFVSNTYDVGDALVVQCNIRDISDRKRSQQALQMSEERYRTLVVASAAIVWNSPSSGEFDSEQPSWTDFTGQTLEQHKGWGWLDAVHPDDRVKSRRAWATALAEQTTYQVEHRLRRKDGEYREMAARAIPILRSGGTIREWVGVHTDITIQKTAEAAVQHVQRRLTHVLASSPAVLFTVKVEINQIRAISWISDNVREVLGYLPEDTFGPDWWTEHVHDEDRDEVADRRNKGLLGQGHSTNEYRFKHQDGQYRWIRSELRLVRDGMGQPVEAVGAWLNITDRKLLEEQFRQAQKMDAFGQLAGGVAHDFNNLLTIINGYSEVLLQRLSPTDPSRSFVNEIYKAGERSAGLTRQLLLFSRQQVLAPRVLDLNEIVKDTEKMLGRIIGEDVSLTFIPGADLWSIRADPGQIEQVLMNLSLNARDAMRGGGRLTIRTLNVHLDEEYTRTQQEARTGPHVLLSISDNGSGMSPEVKERIFEPFFTTKGPGKGTGLGLATVYGIVKQTGGHLAVQSEVGIGTTFTAYFPRVEQEASSPKINPAHLSPPRGTETVLLAEDEDNVRSMARYILIECGYTVLEANDSDHAILQSTKCAGAIDLLVTDVIMPGAGGRAVAEAVIRRHPGARVLFVSGYTDDAVVRQGVLREEVDFLQKPYTPFELARKVRQVLDDKRKSNVGPVQD